MSVLFMSRVDRPSNDSVVSDYHLAYTLMKSYDIHRQIRHRNLTARARVRLYYVILIPSLVIILRCFSFTEAVWYFATPDDSWNT